MRFVLLAALLGLGVSASNAVHAACTGPTPDQAEAFFAEWQSTLSSGDATRLRQLYAADAVVFGLDTAHPATTAPDLSREFQALTQLGVVAPKSRTIATGCGVVRDYGTLVVKERQRTSTLRFSRVYELRDGRWLITLDHLSLGRASAPGSTRLGHVPRPVMPAVAGYLARPMQLSSPPVPAVRPGAPTAAQPSGLKPPGQGPLAVAPVEAAPVVRRAAKPSGAMPGWARSMAGFGATN